ncbi:HD-GYP domain-containing protein [Alkalihalobacillus sp. FSL R5-0424]
MIVPVRSLKEGHVLKKDVFSVATTPLIKSRTVLKETHLTFLRAFSIKEVEIDSLNEVNIEEALQSEEWVEEVRHTDESFFYRYNEAVQAFKRNFESWQAGVPIAIHDVRNLMVPLFNEVIEAPIYLLALHEYNHPKDYRYHHAISVGLLSASLAHKLNYEAKEWVQIGLAAVLADIGMTKMNPSVLDKSGPLTATEYNEIKQHPVHSYQMIKGSASLTDAAKLAVLQHHERLDGEGYPFGSKQSKIHPYSEIIAVADIYHAMSSERVYRAKHSIFFILEEMRRQRFGLLNVSVVLTLTELLLQHSNGATVRLNSGETGEIVFINPQDLTRPMIKLSGSDEIMNLQQAPHQHIEDLLKINKKMLV